MSKNVLSSVFGKNRKRVAWVAFWLFFVVSGGIVLVNWLMSGGAFFGRSISIYVGMEVWSSIVFGVANMVVVGLLGWYLWGVRQEWKMGKTWMGIVLLTMLGLLVTSWFPMKLFDIEWINVTHQVASRGMFVLAILLAIANLAKFGVREETAEARVINWLFLGYAVICGMMFVSGDVFWENVLWVESVYVGMMFAVLMSVPEKMTKK